MQGVESDCQHRTVGFSCAFSVRFLAILHLNNEINWSVFGRQAGSLFGGCTQHRTAGDPACNFSVSQPSAFCPLGILSI